MSVTLAMRRPSASPPPTPPLLSRPLAAAPPEQAADAPPPPSDAEAFRTPPQHRPPLEGRQAARAPDASAPEDPQQVRVHVTPIWQGDARRTEVPSARRVFATLAPWHRVLARRLLIAFTPIAGMAAGLAGYVACRQPNGDAFLDPDTYHGPGATGARPLAVGAASLVGGLLLPWAVAAARRSWGQAGESLQACRGEVSARQVLDQLVEEAVRGAPLTQAGLDSCLERLDALAGQQGLSPADLARGLARLTRAAAARGACPHRSGEAACRQIGQIIAALGRLGLQQGLALASLASALLDVARRIRPETPLTHPQRAELAQALVDEFDRALSRSHTDLARRQWLMDFQALLGGLSGLRSDRRPQPPAPEALQACGAHDLDPGAWQALPRMTLAHALQALREAPPQEVTERAADAVQAALSDPPGAANPSAPSNACVLALAAVSDALRARSDLLPGALLGGVLDPVRASALLRRVQWAEDTFTEDLSQAVFKLANLCQYRATPALHALARQTALALWDEDILRHPDRSRVSTLLKASQQRRAPQLLDGRLSVHPGLGALGERLHLPWLR